MDSTYPTDENLRLIFAQGHEAWLKTQLRETKRFVVRFAIVTGIGIAWVVGILLFVSSANDGEPGCIRLEQGATIAQLVQQDAIAPGTTECTEASAASLLQPNSSGLSNPIKIGLGLATLVVITIVLAAGVETIRSQYKIRKFRAYVLDHAEFLEKYNRA